MGAMTNFRAQDMMGKKTRGARPAAKKAAAAREEKPAADPNEVPEGTADEVVSWAGDDAAKARKALAAEKKNENPRKTVVEPLEKVIAEAKAAKKTESDSK